MADKTPAEIAEMTLQVDGERQVNDPFKLPNAFRQLLITRLADYQAELAAQNSAGGDQASAQGLYRAALEVLEKDAYNSIHGKASFEMSASDKHAWLIRLGFENGEIGEVTNSVRQSRADTILANAPVPTGEPDEIPLLSPTLLAHIRTQRAIVQANQSLAGGGEHKSETQDKNTAFNLLKKAVSRARLYYSASSDDLDATPELDRIGWQARRAYGSVKKTQPSSSYNPLAATSQP